MPRLLLSFFLAVGLLTVSFSGSAQASAKREWLLAQGQHALGKQQPSKALDFFRQALVDSPNDKALLYLAGVAAERAESFSQAGEYYAKAAEAPGDPLPELLLASGRLAYKQGDHAQAEARLEQYTQQNREDPLGYLWLGQAKLAAGKQDDGLKMLVRAGKPEPLLRPIYHYQRGAAIFLTAPDEAVKELEQAAERDKDGRIGNLARKLIELAKQKSELERWYGIDAGLGFQQDNNMLLNTKSDGSLRYSGLRSVLTAAAYGRPEVSENVFVGFGLNLNEARALTVEANGELPNGQQPELDPAYFNIGGLSAMVDGGYLIELDGSAIEPGLEYSFHWGRVADETFDLTHTVAPRALWHHDVNRAAKAYLLFQHQTIYNIDDIAPFGAELSGSLLGLGLAEYLVFESRLDALTVFGEFVAKTAESDTGSYSGPRFGLNGRKRLIADLYLDAGLLGFMRAYQSDQRPSDLVIAVDGGLGYLLFNHLEIDLNAAYLSNFSEDAFAYNRLLTGLFIRGIF